MVDYQALLNQRVQQFTETRYEIAKRIEDMIQSLEKVDPAIIAQLPALPGKTAQEIFPALYTEPFDKEAYDAQLAVYNNYATAVNTVIDQLNKEALQCLSQ